MKVFQAFNTSVRHLASPSMTASSPRTSGAHTSKSFFGLSLLWAFAALNGGRDYNFAGTVLSSTVPTAKCYLNSDGITATSDIKTALRGECRGLPLAQWDVCPSRAFCLAGDMQGCKSSHLALVSKDGDDDASIGGECVMTKQAYKDLEVLAAALKDMTISETCRPRWLYWGIISYEPKEEDVFPLFLVSNLLKKVGMDSDQGLELLEIAGEKVDLFKFSFYLSSQQFDALPLVGLAESQSVALPAGCKMRKDLVDAFSTWITDAGASARTYQQQAFNSLYLSANNEDKYAVDAVSKWINNAGANARTYGQQALNSLYLYANNENTYAIGTVSKWIKVAGTSARTCGQQAFNSLYLNTNNEDTSAVDAVSKWIKVAGRATYIYGHQVLNNVYVTGNLNNTKGNNKATRQKAHGKPYVFSFSNVKILAPKDMMSVLNGEE